MTDARDPGVDRSGGVDAGLPKVARAVDWPDAEAIKRYVDILIDRGISWGLLGPREAPRIWERHILNSVALAPLLPFGSTMVDVGSGAGLPGLPLALLRPDLRVSLLEPLLRRFDFLELAVSELDLGSRVTVVRGRAEDHRGRYDIVTCRAVAPLPRLLAWCLPLVGSGGRLVALKGSSAPEEVEASSDALRRAGAVATVARLAVPGVEEETRAIVVERS
ncbi:MAG: 16S rRNA (guanine(527)-N(7))-methyltransferase RsmG [Propionicimonas sp.]|nr:16S rRNA (guanine(527)-N(7))-methyltransferase RsmG [Propionicimonas sp.]